MGETALWAYLLLLTACCGTSSSTKLFQELHSLHLPIQRSETNPQDWQT
jgi:predicted component of type VI protein secretion system